MSADLPPGWPVGVGRRILAEIDSTNAEGARIAPGLIGPEWILAGFQTGGRGRRGRPWVSPRGNFHASLIERPFGPPERVALRSFAAALALRDALAVTTGAGGALALKWPNDVLLNGGKVAGILLESVGSGLGVAHLAVGIGVNLIAAPGMGDVEGGALRPVSVRDETGLRLAPETLLDALAPAYAGWTRVLDREGFGPLRAAWLSHAARLGQEIRVRAGALDSTGIFETLDDTGALILRTQAGPLTVSAADVFF